MKNKDMYQTFVCALFLWILIAAGQVQAGEFRFSSLWLTSDQAGQRLFKDGKFLKAAEMFSDPMWRGAALYQGGEFEAAATVFARVDSAEAAFNRGNAFVLLGRYEEALGAYDRALQLKPAWKAALENRRIAKIRAKKKERPEGDQGGMTEIGADEIVFDQDKGRKKSGESGQTEGGKAMSENELQAMWLRRVQTRPADFLRARFAYQAARGDDQ